MHCEVELQGAKSDLRIFREAPLSIAGKIKVKADLGYQGIEKIHSNSKIPIKKPNKGELTKNQKKKNKRFRRKRVKVEHVIRRCKCWRIVKETYRNHRRHITQVWLLICGIVNFST